jgi:hypothetical protein
MPFNPVANETALLILTPSLTPIILPPFGMYRSIIKSEYHCYENVCISSSYSCIQMLISI